MSIIQSIILAIIEGLTEFLPISSTGHMVLTSSILGIENDKFTKLFEICIQLGAILAVVALYWKKFFDFSKWQFYVKLMLAVVPALIFGKLFDDLIDEHLGNPAFIATVLLLGGIMLLFVDNWFKKPIFDEEADITNITAIKIGAYQCLAIMFPGLSRSAATIIGGLSQKLSKKAAAEFSFFLAVPTMLAASAKSTLDVYQDHPEVFVTDNLINLCIGGIVAFVVALVSVKFFIQFVQKRGFALFGWYRIALGLSMLTWLFLQKA